VSPVQPHWRVKARSRYQRLLNRNAAARTRRSHTGARTTDEQLIAAGDAGDFGPPNKIFGGAAGHSSRCPAPPSRQCKRKLSPIVPSHTARVAAKPMKITKRACKSDMGALPKRIAHAEQTPNNARVSLIGVKDDSFCDPDRRRQCNAAPRTRLSHERGCAVPRSCRDS
jgi:hypothetical protein